MMLIFFSLCLIFFPFFPQQERLPPCDAASKRYHLYQLWKSYIKKSIVLVGPTLGAALAIDFAVNYPEAVEKMVLINPGVYAEGTDNLAKLPKIVAYAGGVSLLKSIPLCLYANTLTFNGIPLSKGLIEIEKESSRSIHVRLVKYLSQFELNFGHSLYNAALMPQEQEPKGHSCLPIGDSSIASLWLLCLTVYYFDSLRGDIGQDLQEIVQNGILIHSAGRCPKRRLISRDKNYWDPGKR
ncbi:hypothetical protein Patl1_11269 [Pistacia atlantica]|uniref:Uncharacterized protein n=1 Tax=Pistacia atlantica TaxID=434234 RepID=A0ACC1A7G8_9ROSI|nr:hypothetical protein Patl1_11269 [Pistacia atlantica]